MTYSRAGRHRRPLAKIVTLVAVLALLATVLIPTLILIAGG